MVAGTERVSDLTKNTIVTGNMVVHVLREESNAAGINPVGHPIHNNDWLLPPRSTIGTTCDVELLNGGFIAVLGRFAFFLLSKFAFFFLNRGVIAILGDS